MNRVEGIILAAGYSSRTSSFKHALMLEGRPLIHWTIEAMASVCSHIVMVGGYRIKELKNLCKTFPQVEVVENTNFEAGMFSSVKTGVSYIKADRFFLIPGDMPFVDGSVYLSLLAADSQVVIPAYCETRGHPVLFDGALAREITECTSDITLKDFINTKNYTIISVDHKGILADVDTDGDLDKFTEEFFG